MKKLAGTPNYTNMSFDDFCKLESVKYWRQQLSGTNTKNIKGKSRHGGTRDAYTYGLLGFHKWLLNKEFQFVVPIQVDTNILQQHKTITQLAGIEHLLELSRKDYANKADFAHLIKKYLAEMLSVRKQSTTKIAMYSIRSFFRENESDITFQFKHRINRNEKKHHDQLFTIEDLWGILTVNDIQPIEKAVLLCKFQRGLDSSTLVDRFNFEVWECLLKHFRSENPESWNLNNTPIPIPLVRVKTGFMHTGFLDVDAVVAITEYLKTRQDKPKIDNALFVDTEGNPITVNWIYKRFRKLAARSKLQNHVPNLQTKNQYRLHRMRDLLKSTLIDSGCRPDVADHIIGHSPKDSYEKQFVLYPESSIHEFSKASERINLLTGSTNYSCKKHSTTQNNKTVNDKPCNLTFIERSVCSIQKDMNQHQSHLLRLENILYTILSVLENTKIKTTQT